MGLPHLRYVTQAGGRLAPDRVARYAGPGPRRRLGAVRHVRPDRGDGPDGVPAAGPRRRASARRSASPIPGGSFRLRAAAGLARRPDIGELVYAGPNVMLGYAESPADLGPGPDRRRAAHRRHRPAHPRRAVRDRRPAQPVREDPRPAHRPAAGRGDARASTASPPAAPATTTSWWWPSRGPDAVDAARVRRLVARRVRPARPRGPRPRPRRTAPAGHRQAGLPRPYASWRRPSAPTRATGAAGGDASGPVDLRRLYAEILDRADVTEDSSFVSLGGDSLSLRRDVAAPRGGARPPARRTGTRCRSASSQAVRGSRPRAGRNPPPHPGDQRRPARRRDRADRRLAHPALHVKGGAHVLLGGRRATTSPASTSPTPTAASACGTSGGSIARIAAAEHGLDRADAAVTDDYGSPTSCCSPASSDQAPTPVALLVHRGPGLHPGRPSPPCSAVPLRGPAERRFPFAVPAGPRWRSA